MSIANENRDWGEGSTKYEVRSTESALALRPSSLAPRPLSLARRPSERRRRGVLLLVVLSVLVLFVLLTVTYVLVATKERGATKAIGRYEQSGDSPAQLLDSLAMVLFRDTTDIHSPFHTWSLLEGIYGNVSFHGAVGNKSGTANGTGGQFYNIVLASIPAGYQSANYYYQGCILTMLSGPSAGLSARIVGSNSTGLTVMRFHADAGLIDPNVGDAFLVNGPAYAGMGRGFDWTGTTKDSAGKLALWNGLKDQNNREYALLPNPAYFQANTTSNPTYTDPTGNGGANVDYTAYDYNNMYLGLVNNTGGILPSFHRADLYAYWVKRSGGMTADLARKIMFRPTTFDHPIFCAATNPQFSVNPGISTYPLDVDNMGSGVPDSIWIDPGLPVMTSKDGRTYKVLVAPLILDLDSRVNLNAHGSYAQQDSNFQQTSTGPLASLSPVQLSTGLGFGPADVDLTRILSSTEMQNIFGVGPNNINLTTQGRHGLGVSPVSNRPMTAVKMFEYPLNDYRDVTKASSPYDVLTSFGTPGDLKARRTVGLDYRGQPLFITPGGNATNGNYWANEVFDFVNSSNLTKAVDSPYGIDLNAPRPGRGMQQAGLDNPFTAAELERVLRSHDVDARSLAPRLASLLTSLDPSTSTFTPAQIAAKTNDLTTDSWDSPVPSIAVPRDFRPLVNAYWIAMGYDPTTNPAYGSRAFQLVDLLRAKLFKSFTSSGKITAVPKPSAATINQVLDAELANILPPEIFAGLKMDINRPFGNGRDDNGDGIVDEPPLNELGQPQNETGNGNPPPQEKINKSDFPYWPSSYPASVNLDITDNVTKPQRARQLMARYLYTLVMAFSNFSDKNFSNWTTDPLAAANIQAANARRAAQWAINAVCFRDSSSVMTPFVYHSHIFGTNYTGWTATGDPSQVPPNQSPSADLQIVWGCKPPDIVMTETLAFHDRGTADTAFDDSSNPHHEKYTDNNPPTKHDPNFDQVRVPQGSLFVELYCCRNPSNPIYPTDLYTKDKNTGQWCLELSKQAPDGNPVWRMVITDSTTNLTTAANTNKDSFTIQNDTTDNVTTMKSLIINTFSGGLKANVDRIIWFPTVKPPTPATKGLFYNWNQTPIFVPPAAYAVIGPRTKTYVGSVTNSSYCVKTTQQVTAQSITVSATNATSSNTANADPKNADRKQVVGVIVAANPPANWGNVAKTAPQGIGLNVSEPLPTDPLYYKEPTVQDPGTGIMDAYGGTPNAANNGLDGDAALPFLDNPLELGVGDPNAASRPLSLTGVAKTGTHQLYKHVVLQRLADPRAAWDKVKNPYITVDWMPIDLTTFSGEQGSGDPFDIPQGQVNFASRQRGGYANTNPPPANGSNLWAQPTDALPGDPGGIHGWNFDHPLEHTIGYLNKGFGQGFTQATAPAGPWPSYAGDPQKPFPWITWNARPYANVMELLLVPGSSPDRLLMDFSSPGTISDTSQTDDPYFAANVSFHAPFQHLFNFFNSTDYHDPADKGETAGNLYRVLDYLTVPSRFIGSDTLLNPNFFSSSPGQWPFLPPFNKVSNYRDPGRININTVTSPDVLAALIGVPMSNPMYQSLLNKLILSRRGDGKTNNSGLITADPDFPTSVAAPFRAAGGADLVPLGNMLHRGVDLSLLRADPSVPPSATGVGANPERPLFGLDTLKALGTTVGDYNQPARNSYFYYQGLERIGNNVTTRSNVFAVWLTVGYFEVLPWPQKGINFKVNPVTELTAADYKAHADGYQLGAELGSDTGDIVRHRAFYIFDRSIPVGYERGQNNNVNRAILLRRYIE
jgi:hypothetical protein